MAEEDFVWAVKSEGHLAANKAGGSARAQADQLLAMKPARSRLARLLRVHTDERAYRLGALGEEAVGARLSRLDQTKWLTLHDVILNEKGTNLDHLVIGPPGVFSLNTKHRPNAKVRVTKRTLRVNGYQERYLPVAAREAAKVAGLLGAAIGHPVQVNPVIVLVGAELDVRYQPDDVFVLSCGDLPNWFLSLPDSLSHDRMQELKRVAGRPSTWKPPPLPNRHALHLKRWHRHGLRRLYVNDSNGTSLGYLDEATGEVHVTDPANLTRVTEALAVG